MSPDGTHMNAVDLSMEMEQKAERVINLGDAMSDLLATEMDVLAQRNTQIYGQFVSSKQKLLMDYQGAVKALLGNRESFASLTPVRRAQIKATGSRLDAMARQNAEKLSMTATATHKLLQVMIDSVRREAQSQQPSGYHPSQFSQRDERIPTVAPAFVAEKA